MNAQNDTDRGKVKLLSGGNPQIPKGEGDEPVQAYIEAMPGWKSALGRTVDDLVTKELGTVNKAVKWNQPLWGVDDGWFLSMRCFTKYVQLTFFRGDRLTPPPPKESKHDDIRYLDIREDDEVDEKQLAEWIRQSAKLPGQKM
ncbi:MAG TPA: DUF1801 domain-containing protein [Terrimesophilobacter sp.]|nr:DUF1801 domain-containing protein [Terrimesophilobacter sp.]HRP99351.1 DUF1801 domain-containing protein [Terrimesophilobacter sp.]